jgi:UPF0755 protein
MKYQNRTKKAFSMMIIFIFMGVLFFINGILPVNKNDKKTKIFVISQGESIDSITKNLFRSNLIRSRLVFRAIIIQLGIKKSVQAGDFRLSPSMNAYEIARSLTHGTLDKWVTIIEGLRKEEIADIISSTIKFSKTEFINKAREGYLFPDTYLIPKDASAETVISILENNFDKKFTDDLKSKGLKKNLSPEEFVIFASLVEKEGRSDRDRLEVASIILKRLNVGMKLDIDATLQYALGYQPKEKTWWKKSLTNYDKSISSPYNTYKNAGLPPGPICNPGLSSMIAVANADPDTPYLYYMHDEKGIPHYARTLEEQNSNINRYLK